MFVLNCLTYLVDTLAPYPCAARKREELDDVVEARVLELIEEHVRFLLVLRICYAERSLLNCSMRQSSAIRACMMPSVHVNRPQKT